MQEYEISFLFRTVQGNMFRLHIKESCYIFMEMTYKLSDIMFISMKHICTRNSWNHFSMNCLYASHIHKDISVYHAFMHTVKSSCHNSLPEQSGLLRSQEHPMVQPRVSAWRNKFVVSRTSLRCLSFYINKAEVMYKFK